MRLHRFYIDKSLDLNQGAVIADKELIHQWQKVFRLKPGDSLVLFDGSGFDFVSVIKMISRNEAIVETKEKSVSRFVSENKLHLFLAIAKKDNFELAIEKCTELGVTEFTPVISERTEKKNINLERAKVIVREASEQSGRGTLPIVHEAISFGEMVRIHGKDMLILHTSGETFSKEVLSGGIIKIAIGPEGGWSDKEVENAKENGSVVLTLGKQILRAETAAVSIASLVIFRDLI